MYNTLVIRHVLSNNEVAWKGSNRVIMDTKILDRIWQIHILFWIILYSFSLVPMKTLPNCNIQHIKMKTTFKEKTKRHAQQINSYNDNKNNQDYHALFENYNSSYNRAKIKNLVSFYRRRSHARSTKPSNPRPVTINCYHGDSVGPVRLDGRTRTGAFF